jgi:fructose-1,6-bisphosphatase II
MYGRPGSLDAGVGGADEEEAGTRSRCGGPGPYPAPGLLAPQSAEEREAIQAAGMDEKQIWTQDEMVHTDRLLFAATGITDSALLPGVMIQGSYAKTYSLLIRSETGTRRFIQAEHAIFES